MAANTYNNNADSAVEYSSSEEGREQAIDYSSSEEEYDYDDIFESGDEEDYVRHGVPVPSGFEDIESAVKNFGAVFEQRYGNAGPSFRPVTLKEALAEAFDSQEVGLRKPLALYLHNDKSIAANIFAGNVLGNKNVAASLKDQFVVWGCDVTQETMTVHLITWLDDVNALSVADYVDSTPVDSFPLLLVVQKDQGSIKITASATGIDDAATVTQKLVQVVAGFDTVKARLTAEARERAERERLRNEQQAAYEIGKEQDRIKFEARDKLLREQREADEALAREEQTRIEKEAADKIRHAELAATMPDEPNVDAAGIIMIKFRFPDNHQEVRRFLRKDSLKLLSHFAGSRGYLGSDYRIFTSDFPRKNVTSLNADATFDELGWPPREQVIVEEI